MHPPTWRSWVAASYLVARTGKWQHFLTLGLPEPCSCVYSAVQKIKSKSTVCVSSCPAVLQFAHVPDAAAVAGGPLIEQLHGHKLTEEHTLGLASAKVTNRWPVAVTGP